MRIVVTSLVLSLSALVALAPSCGGGSGGSPDGGAGGSGDAGPIDVPPELTGLPELTNVVADPSEDSVLVRFDPFDDARDYRVYPMPDPQFIQKGSDGALVIKDAVYRCAGDRQTFDAHSAHEPPNGVYSNSAMTTFDDTDADIVGYAYATAGAGRVPVYVVGLHPSFAEGSWREARLKVYTTSATERDMLVSTGGGRDDGIAFYIPETPPQGAVPVYTSESREIVAGQGWTQYHRYYLRSSETSAHMMDTDKPAMAFSLLPSAEGGAAAVRRVGYDNDHHHDELLLGKGRFKRAAYQGNSPLWSVEWSGIKEPTVLVVEALDGGCPYQGFLAGQHLDQTLDASMMEQHPPILTLTELQAKSPTGEVFINGQHDTMTAPRAIARSFLRVGPQPHDPKGWDFYTGFSTPIDVKPMPYMNCNQTCLHFASSGLDVTAENLDFGLIGGVIAQTFSAGTTLGQLWVAYDDTGSDVTGKVRLTPTQKAMMDADPAKFLRVTMSVDAITTGRRYPQMIVSTAEIPVQQGLGSPDADTLIVQPIQGPNEVVQIQAFHGLVNGKAWDVNNQAPAIELSTAVERDEQPVESMFEHAGVDRQTKFEVWASKTRVYVFVDGSPMGCADLSTASVPTGPVTVTFGDVLYHEGAQDEGVCAQDYPYNFLHRHQCSLTKRHFDDLGFHAGEEAPPWDEARLPCKAY